MFENHPWVRDAIRCPACHATLTATPETLTCTSADCGLEYPVVDGIPVLLTSDARPSTTTQA